ncbi:MAG TPA: TetR/AcrR family transcriptional regulator [Mycoplana sp.]|nr:TetR/AcrR family transcriptional regulator [Mycoplana sp.]
MSRQTSPKAIEPRQTRAIATRARLLEVVETIVAEDGADAVTTTRVATEAGTAVGTIYRYFEDRDAMLLGAYDATVTRLVAACHEALDGMPDAMAMDEAARHLLDVYLDAAERLPAHSGLLNAMRQLRAVKDDQDPENSQILTELIAPFLARFAPEAVMEPLRVRMVGAVLITLVDLYLVTPDVRERTLVRTELEAHLLFMLTRLI